MQKDLPTSYLLKARKSPQHRFAYIGVPHDAATSLGNPGARFGPGALREALKGTNTTTVDRPSNTMVSAQGIVNAANVIGTVFRSIQELDSIHKDENLR